MSCFHSGNDPVEVFDIQFIFNLLDDGIPHQVRNGCVFQFGVITDEFAVAIVHAQGYRSHRLALLQFFVIHCITKFPICKMIDGECPCANNFLETLCIRMDQIIIEVLDEESCISSKSEEMQLSLLIVFTS